VKLETSQRNDGNISLWGAILGAVLIVAVTVFLRSKSDSYSLQNQKQSRGSESTNSTSISLSPTSISTYQIESKTEWKTYVNKKFGIQIRYPKEIKLIEDPDGSFGFSLWGPSQTEGVELYDGIAVGFTAQELGDMTLQEYAKSQVRQMKANNLNILLPLKETRIGDQDCFMVRVRGLGEFRYIYLVNKQSNTVIQIEDGTRDPTNKGFQEIVDTILSTLAFN
jgi:hypothetical protein